MTEVEKKTGMTDDECEYWDNYFTNQNYVPTGPNLLDFGIKPGMASKFLKFNELNKEVVRYLYLQSEKYHKTPAQVVNELVQEKLTVGT